MYVPKANVDYTISGQGTAISTLDHSATTSRTNLSLLTAGKKTFYVALLNVLKNKMEVQCSVAD